MSTMAYQSGTDELLSIYFATEGGVDAGRLGVFLSRMNTVARRAGVDIEIVAIEPGSLDVLSRVVNRAIKEVKGSPIQATVAALIAATQIGPSLLTPFSKSAADIIIEDGVHSIELRFAGNTYVLIDREGAELLIRHSIEKSEVSIDIDSSSAVEQTVKRVSIGQRAALDTPPQDTATEFFGSLIRVGHEWFMRLDDTRSLIFLDFSNAKGDRDLGVGRFIIRGKVAPSGVKDGIFVTSYSRI